MPYTARQLITRAYYLSGIVSRNYQSVSGDRITDGFELLNELLAEKGITGSLISYFSKHSFNAVIGQEKYFIANLMDIETLTFTIDTVRYSMLSKRRGQYFGTGRANNVQSLPYEWHIERTKGGSNLYIYFLPDQNYPMEIYGKFGLDEVANLDYDMLLAYDRFYLHYLTYNLASEICNELQQTFPPQSVKALESLEQKLTLVSPLDLTTLKRSMFQTQRVVNYGQANLGRGWTP